jgi:hypothetical protein
MEHIRRLLFEDRVLLLLVCVAGLAIALGYHRRHLNDKSRRGVWITLGVCALLLLMQALIKTDRERLEGIVHSLVEAVDAGDMATIASSFDPEGVRIGTGVHQAEFEHAVFVNGTRLGLETWSIDEAGAGSFEFEVEGDKALVTFRASCQISNQKGLAGRPNSRWELHFRRRPEGWKIDQIISGEIVMGFLESDRTIDLIPDVKGFCRRAPVPPDR